MTNFLRREEKSRVFVRNNILAAFLYEDIHGKAKQLDHLILKEFY